MIVRLYHADFGSRLFSATPSAPDTAAIVDSAKVAPLDPEKSSSA